ncbi:mucin-17-like isoform X2 [Gigantopelta aegis]|uniref:mucin-17-like isoform X2 n=2 Tax=Gigantopelta aegis TaxID=1735272 RepID=UPI001B88B928|nr:mucin-17-like isoform X2 [Gigantopelta aegis]
MIYDEVVVEGVDNRAYNGASVANGMEMHGGYKVYYPSSENGCASTDMSYSGKKSSGTESETYSGRSTQRRHTCRVLLVVFLILCLLGVVVAAVIVAVLLTRSPSPVPEEKFVSSIRLPDKNFTKGLADKTSDEFKAAEEEFCSELLNILKAPSSPVESAALECSVLQFRNGSLIILYQVTVKTRRIDMPVLKLTIRLTEYIIEVQKSGRLGNLKVDADRHCKIVNAPTFDESTDDICPSVEGTTTSVTPTPDLSKTTTPKELTSTPKEVTTTPKDATTPKEITTPKQVTTTPKEVTTTPKDVTTTPKDVTTPKEITTTPKEVTTTPKDVTTTPKDVTTPEEITTTPKEVTTPKETTTALSISPSTPSEQETSTVTTIDSSPVVITPSASPSVERDISATSLSEVTASPILALDSSKTTVTPTTATPASSAAVTESQPSPSLDKVTASTTLTLDISKASVTPTTASIDSSVGIIASTTLLLVEKDSSSTLLPEVTASSTVLESYETSVTSKPPTTDFSAELITPTTSPSFEKETSAIIQEVTVSSTLLHLDSYMTTTTTAAAEAAEAAEANASSTALIASTTQLSLEKDASSSLLQEGIASSTLLPSDSYKVTVTMVAMVSSQEIIPSMTSLSLQKDVSSTLLEKVVASTTATSLLSATVSLESAEAGETGVTSSFVTDKSTSLLEASATATAVDSMSLTPGLPLSTALLLETPSAASPSSTSTPTVQSVLESEVQTSQIETLATTFELAKATTPVAGFVSSSLLFTQTMSPTSETSSTVADTTAVILDSWSISSLLLEGFPAVATSTIEYTASSAESSGDVLPLQSTSATLLSKSVSPGDVSSIASSVSEDLKDTAKAESSTIGSVLVSYDSSVLISPVPSGLTSVSDETTATADLMGYQSISISQFVSSDSVSGEVDMTVTPSVLTSSSSIQSTLLDKTDSSVLSIVEESTTLETASSIDAQSSSVISPSSAISSTDVTAIVETGVISSSDLVALSATATVSQVASLVYSEPDSRSNSHTMETTDILETTVGFFSTSETGSISASFSFIKPISTYYMSGTSVLLDTSPVSDIQATVVTSSTLLQTEQQTDVMTSLAPSSSSELQSETATLTVTLDKTASKVPMVVMSTPALTSAPPADMQTTLGIIDSTTDAGLSTTETVIDLSTSKTIDSVEFIETPTAVNMSPSPTVSSSIETRVDTMTSLYSVRTSSQTLLSVIDVISDSLEGSVTDLLTQGTTLITVMSSSLILSDGVAGLSTSDILPSRTIENSDMFSSLSSQMR